MSSIVSAAFQSLLSDLKGDVLAVVLPLLDTMWANVLKNPTLPNFQAQLLIVVTSLPLQVPNLEQAVITQLATIGQELTKALAAKAA